MHSEYMHSVVCTLARAPQAFGMSERVTDLTVDLCYINDRNLLSALDFLEINSPSKPQTLFSNYSSTQSANYNSRGLTRHCRGYPRHHVFNIPPHAAAAGYWCFLSGHKVTSNLPIHDLLSLSSRARAPRLTRSRKSFPPSSRPSTSQLINILRQPLNFAIFDATETRDHLTSRFSIPLYTLHASPTPSRSKLLSTHNYPQDGC